MQEVKKLYQIAVVITDKDKRMIVASQSNGEPELVLDIQGEEAVGKYHAFLELFDRKPEKN